MKTKRGYPITRYIFIFILSSILLSGCTIDRSIKQKNSVDSQVGKYKISMNEANEIALKQAVIDGYESPTIWGETRISYVYSIKYDKDVEAWLVLIKTAARPTDNIYDAFYSVSPANGEIILTID